MGDLITFGDSGSVRFVRPSLTRVAMEEEVSHESPHCTPVAAVVRPNIPGWQEIAASSNGN